MLVYTGITPFRLKSFSKFTVLIGLSNTPIQFPLTNTLVLFASALGLHSVSNFNGVFALIHLIIG